MKEQASPPAYPELRPLQAYYVVLLEHVVRRLPFRRDSPLLHHVLDPTLAIVLRRCAWPIRCIFLHYCRRGRLPSGEGGGEEDAAESEGCGPEDRGRGTVHRPVMDLEGIKVFASDFGLMPGLMEEKLVETLHTYVLRSFAAPEPLTLNTLSVRGEYALPGLTFSAFVELLARCAMFCCPPEDKFTQRQAVEEVREGHRGGAGARPFSPTPADFPYSRARSAQLACTFSSPAVGQRDRRQAVGTQRDMWRRREDTTPLSGTSSSHTVPLPLRADIQVIPGPGKALGPAGRRRVATAAIARPSTRRSASAGQVRREPVPRTGTATHDWDAALQVRYPSRFRGHSRRPQTAAAAHMRGVTSKARSDAKSALGLLQGADRASWSMPPPSGGAGGHGSKLAPQAASAHPSGWGNTVAGVGPAAYKTVGVSTAPGAGLARGPNQWDVVHEPAASMAVKAAQERDGRRATRLRRVGTRAQRDRMLARLGGQALGRLDLQLRSHQPTDGTFAPCPGPAPEALFAYQRKYVEAAAPARQPAARAAFARGRDGARGAGCGDTGTGPHPIHRVGGEGGAGRAQGATLRPRSAGPRKATARGVVSLSNALPAGTKERSAE